MNAPTKPTKRTDDRRELILDLLRQGHARKTAYQAARISEDTWTRWRQEDVSFVEEIEAAEAAATQDFLASVHTASAEDWRAAAWWLERRRAEDYSKVDRTELTGAQGGAVQVKIVSKLAAVLDLTAEDVTP